MHTFFHQYFLQISYNIKKKQHVLYVIVRVERFIKKFQNKLKEKNLIIHLILTIFKLIFFSS